MSDLIERLRPNPDDYCQKLRIEAADEIERLETALQKIADTRQVTRHSTYEQRIAIAALDKLKDKEKPT